MMEYDPRIKLNVFGGATTYQTDYQKFNPDKRYRYSWPQARTELPSKKSVDYQPTDHESFSKWRKESYVPSNLHFKPKPIIETIPRATFSTPDEYIDTEKESIIKTRPRRYISPAVSIDDIPDPEMRKLLIEYMYTTDWKKAEKEAAQPVTNREIPNSTWELGGDPVALQTVMYPPIPRPWRGKGKVWDIQQRRGRVDPTQTFWLNKEVKCGACINPFKGMVPQEIKNKIANLIHADKLRLAHDYAIPGYAGYRPRLPAGVPLSKVQLPVTHPFLSTAQAITQRYTDDKNSE